MDDQRDLYAPYLQPRGPAYRDDQVDSRLSHYNDPIDRSPGRFAGNSHIHGDASAETQAAVMDALVEAFQRAGLDDKDTAYVLATARFESGFNPDAAAGTTSAYGVGKLVRRTGHSKDARWNSPSFGRAPRRCPRLSKLRASIRRSPRSLLSPLPSSRGPTNDDHDQHVVPEAHRWNTQ